MPSLHYCYPFVLLLSNYRGSRVWNSSCAIKKTETTKYGNSNLKCDVCADSLSLSLTDYTGCIRLFEMMNKKKGNTHRCCICDIKQWKTSHPSENFLNNLKPLAVGVNPGLAWWWPWPCVFHTLTYIRSTFKIFFSAIVIQFALHMHIRHNSWRTYHFHFGKATSWINTKYECCVRLFSQLCFLFAVLFEWSTLTVCSFFVFSNQKCCVHVDLPSSMSKCEMWFYLFRMETGENERNAPQIGRCAKSTFHFHEYNFSE